MAQTGKYHGGLVFVGTQEQALEKISRIVTATLEDYGHPIERKTILSAEQASIVTSHNLVRLTLGGLRPPSALTREIRLDSIVGLNAQRRARMEEDAQRLEIEISSPDGTEDSELVELMMVVMLYRMVSQFSVRQIEWLSPDTILTVDQFLGAFASVTPRRAGSETRADGAMASDMRFGPVDTALDALDRHCESALASAYDPDDLAMAELSEDEILALAYRYDDRTRHAEQILADDDAPSDVRRLATWGMTGMMVFLSAPVAASMAAVNLARGEDFRLNTHVLSLTGFLVAMQSSGALAHAVSYLPL